MSDTIRSDGIAFEVKTVRIIRRPLRLFIFVAFLIFDIVVRIPNQPGSPFTGVRVFAFVLALGSLLPVPRLRGAILRVDDTWVLANGVPIVRRDQLTHVVARGGTDGKRAIVVLGVAMRNGAGTDVILSSREDADALVLALGGGVHQSIARFSAEERSVSVFRVVVFALAVALITRALFTGMARPLMYPFITLVVAPMIALMMRRKLTVGGDGVFIEPLVPFMFKSTFVPHAIIDGILVHDQIVSLVIDGKERRFSFAGKKKKKFEHAGAAALATRIREAQARYEASRMNTDARMVVGLVARGGRSVTAWLAAVRDLVDGPISVRRLSFAPERLLGVVEDPTVDPEARAGAAAALANVSAKDHDVKDRLRAAANVTAEPALRRVLELATNPDESGLEGALDEVPPSRHSEPQEPKTQLDAEREAGEKTSR